MKLGQRLFMKDSMEFDAWLSTRSVHVSTSMADEEMDIQWARFSPTPFIMTNPPRSMSTFSNFVEARDALHLILFVPGSPLQTRSTQFSVTFLDKVVHPQKLQLFKDLIFTRDALGPANSVIIIIIAHINESNQEVNSKIILS